MLSMVIADYKARFKWKNIKKIFNVSFIPLIYTFLFPVWNGSVAEKLTFWSMLIGFMCSVLISRLYPFELSQIMYLVPMSHKDKQKYLSTAYVLRCSFIIVVTTILIVAACIYEKVNTVIACIMIIDNILVALVSNAVLPSANKTDKNGKMIDYNNYTIQYTVILIMLTLGSMFLPFFTYNGMNFNEFMHSLFAKILIVYQLIIVVYSLIFIKCNWNMVMQNALNFEKSSFVTDAVNRKR